MSGKNLPVPLMREQLQGALPTKPSSTPALVAVIWFVVCSFLGLIVGYFLGAILFLFVVIFGILTAIAAFFLAKKLGSVKPLRPMQQQILLAYQPFFARLNSTGFEAAVDDARLILRHGYDIYHSQGALFGVVDESLQFTLSKLVEVANAAALVGDKRELRRKLDRLEATLKSYREQQERGQASQTEIEGLKSQTIDMQMRLDRLEELQKTALELTKDMAKIRQECERALVERLAGEEAVKRSREMLTEKLEREKRVVDELKLLGL